MIISYIFKNPKLSRDSSFLVHLIMIFIAMYCEMKKKFLFLKFLLPYFGLCNYLIESGFGMLSDEKYSIVKESIYCII